VILDVVYNHFGNLSNTVGEFSDDYTTDRYGNEWGKSNNLDGERSAAVREFFLANARYWIEEFHLDGYRFDATQAIHDASDEHILTALAGEARQAAGKRGVLLVAENEPQDSRLVRSPQDGGHGLDMVWNDDFHHAAVVRLTGRSEAYYSDYLGDVEEFLATLKHGFLYQGQHSRWQNKPRGTPTRGLPQWAFVNYLETHDQVANSARGTRLHRLTSPGRLRAMTVLWLLSPQTPMFFQGQEFASSADFLYFADHAPEHRRMVAEGRIGFLSQFPSINTNEMRGAIPEPSDRDTFERCALDFQERVRHAPVYDLHRDLLRLRREDAVFSAQRSDLVDCASHGPDALIVRYFGDESGDRLLLVNFGRDLSIAPAPQPLIAAPPGQVWQLLFSSEAARYGGRGTPPLEREEGWHVPGEAAMVLKSVPAGSPPVLDLIA
jgi:maltooligosyltrehalose trehalohydrolase